MVSKDPIVVGVRPELTRLEFIVTVRCVWLWKCLQPTILLSLRYSNCIMFLHGS